MGALFLLTAFLVNEFKAYPGLKKFVKSEEKIQESNFELKKI